MEINDVDYSKTRKKNYEIKYDWFYYFKTLGFSNQYSSPGSQPWFTEDKGEFSLATMWD